MNTKEVVIISVHFVVSGLNEPEVEEVFKSFTEVKPCRNGLLQVKTLHLKYHIGNGTKTLASKYTLSITT